MDAQAGTYDAEAERYFAESPDAMWRTPEHERPAAPPVAPGHTVDIARYADAAKWAAAVALYVAGFVPVYLVAQINLDASASQGSHWANWAVGATCLTAALWIVATVLLLRRKFISCLATVAFTVPFFALGVFVAVGNVASIDTLASETRSAQSTAESTHASRLKDATDRRDKAKADAKGESEASANAKIEKAKIEHPSTWTYSHECNAKHINLEITQEVCGEINALRVKAAAAKAYEKAVDEIAGIEHGWETHTQTAPLAKQSTTQGAAVNMVAVAKWLGYSNTKPEDAERAFEWWRAGSAELGAAMGPAVSHLLAWLLLGIGGGHTAEEFKRRSDAEEAEARWRIRQSQLIAEEAEVRTNSERRARKARFDLERDRADWASEDKLAEKKRQAAILATPVTSPKEVKERLKVEQGNEIIKSQREKAARQSRDLKNKTAKKRSDLAVGIQRFIDERTRDLPSSVDPWKAKILMDVFRTQYNAWARQKSGPCEESPIKFGNALKEVAPEASLRKHGVCYFIGRELLAGSGNTPVAHTPLRNGLFSSNKLNAF